MTLIREYRVEGITKAKGKLVPVKLFERLKAKTDKFSLGTDKCSKRSNMANSTLIHISSAAAAAAAQQSYKEAMARLAAKK